MHDYRDSLAAVLQAADMLYTTVKVAHDHDKIDPAVAESIHERLLAFHRAMYGS